MTTFARKAIAGLLSLLTIITTAEAHAETTLTLARALRLARARAPELEGAKAQVASADAQADVARAGYLPTFSLSGTAAELGSSDQAPIIPPQTRALTSVTYTTAATATASVRWTVLDFGRTSHAVDAADAARDASAASVRDADATLAAAVASAYLDVVYAEKVRDIERAIVDDRERSTQVVKALAKQGLAPAVDELRVRSRLEAARRDLETADSLLAEARVGLLAFLGIDPRSSPLFTAPRLPRPRADVEGAIKEADVAGPTVAAARHTVASEEAGVGAARARYYPSVALNGDASYRHSRLDVFDQWLPTKTASAAVVVSIPVYDPTIAPRLAAARADVAKASATYDQARRDARSEAAKSVVALATSERVLEHAQKAADGSAAVLAVIRARYTQGIASMLDLIEAESSDAEARVAAIRAERAVDGATVRVLTATGHAARLYAAP